MIWTRASVELDANDKGLEPVQVDGIPEGFSWKQPDVTVGDVLHVGKYVVYGPLGLDVVECRKQQDMVNIYNSFKRNNG